MTTPLNTIGKQELKAPPMIDIYPTDVGISINERLMAAVAFYFGNKNYYCDAFLQSKLDSNRFVAVSELSKFN